MTYNAGLATTRDRIRLMVFDRSGDPATELLPDQTYDAVIATYANWKRAAADMAEAVAVQLDQKPTGITIPGEVTETWGERAKTLRTKAIALRAEADREDVAATSGIGQMISVRAPYLTGRGY